MFLKRLPIFFIFLIIKSGKSDEEFKTLVLQKIAGQDAKIEQLESKNVQLEIKVEAYKNIFQNGLNSLEGRLELQIANMNETNEQQIQLLATSEELINDRIDNLASDLEITNLMAVPTSCAELRKHGLNSTKTLLVDSDGKGRGDFPIKVPILFLF